ncbi:MAG: ABC transporter permease [Planctomycetes bacterium]|nr:ABC transporter permease [Planctomycetota bacterium]
MAGLRESLAELGHELRQQRLRALLSLSGVAWGTLSILLLLAFSVGFAELFARRQQGLGTGIAIAWPSRTTKAWQGLPPGRRIRPTHDDIRALALAVPGLEALSAEFVAGERLQVGARVLRVELSGVDPEFGRLRQLEPRPGGRFLNAADQDGRRRVVFLGDDLARSLFGADEPVGRTLLLREAPFTVVGVLRTKEQDSDYGALDEDRAFVPAATFADVYGTRLVNNFVYRAADPARQEACTDRIVQALAARLRFDPTDRGALGLWDTTEEQRMVATIFLAFHVVLGMAGVFTLLAGGVGIANLMFLLVRRRTSEIGLKLAVGARPAQVRREVLVQTLVLVGAGGTAGAVLAAGAVALARSGPWIAETGVPRIPTALGAGAALLLLAVGVLAGWFPARRAAGLDPAEALRE